ncbi:MAG: ATP-binding protein [Candidatus Cryptobacteroides sp.]|nr:ATP-binding protein [Candidatus Cryptobacteroides sp.]
MEILTRQHYADIVDSWIGKDNIIALVGSRRVGKSYILKDFIQRHSQDENSNIIYVDKEKKDFKSIKTKDDLDTWIEQRFIRGKHNYILIDEVQEIDNFEESVCSWYSEDDTDVLITGSNSDLLSGELATRLSGRHVEIRVHPLTYMEFLQFHSLQDSDESLMTYMNYGGLPGLRTVGLDNEEQVWAYIASVFNTIMLKDIIERYDIRNIPFLNNLIAFYADTTGKLTSANSISKYMKSQNENVSSNLILLYRSFYSEAFLIDVVSRYDIHGKKIFESNEKIYWDDLGLRNLKASGGMDSYIEKVIENVVYKQLSFLGYDIKVGVLNAGEVDFVCTKAGQTIYVQASYIIAEDTTREREFGPLEKIRDNYPKYVISATPYLTKRNENGIIHLSLRKFLTEGL